ncbi:hypothetical protein [Solibacillus sp. CAU 1738]|uniref:hypothetical protein n=1 Tax=Solibacillus sp. CAU 1738 TaxID=3140363 RepID=UPI003260D42D
MNKMVPPLLSLFCILIYGLGNGSIYANKIETPQHQPFEEIFTEGGYKTIGEAVQDFESHYNQKLKLPLRVPPISFTHHFGRFSNLEGDINDSLDMKLISDQSPENQFSINVRHIKYKIDFGNKHITEVYKLNNGIEAKYIELPNSGFNMLVFEIDNWQYTFDIDRRVAEKVTPDILVQIANSIDFKNERR